MTEPLPTAQAHIVQQAAAFTWDGDGLEPGIALALSGGGFRAMLFHAGALMRLHQLGILARVARISSVSGGSIAAGFLAAAWKSLAGASSDQFKQMYVDPILAFSRERIDVGDILTGFLPGTSASAQVAASYDKALLHNITLQDIPDAPQFVFCATNLQSGVLWRFTKAYAGDYVVGRIDKPAFPLSTAVAASSAFPPFLSPVVLNPAAGSVTDWPGRAAGAGGVIDPAPYRARVLLADGGVYDNHGLEPVVKRYMTVLASDGGAPFGRSVDVATDPVRQLQRVYDVTDNQVRALRRRDLIGRFQAAQAAQANGTLKPDGTDPQARFGTYWGIDTDPTKAAPPGALAWAPATVNALAHLATRLSDPGEMPAKQLVNWGYTICDRCVRSYYDVADIQGKPGPAWPYPEAPLG
ncbi:MAG TPA: patatin-like phospholipase family protein [Xanthobacteraceae bacterium]|nr:patatin-like phospholipase family protein [Xanthobacteraceae bacterium]